MWDTTSFNNPNDWPADGQQPFVLSTGDTYVITLLCSELHRLICPVLDSVSTVTMFSVGRISPSKLQWIHLATFAIAPH